MRIGILSFSDGREKVHKNLIPEIEKSRDTIVNFLQKQEGFEIVTGSQVIHTPNLARREAAALISKGVDAVIFNIPVFAFPNFALIAAKICQIPPLIYSPPNPKLPGIGGMLAAAGSLKQAGIKCERVWGNLNDPAIQRKLLAFLKAQTVVRRLWGQVYGLIGGRSIGMGTGTIDPAQWMRKFGVDVEHIDQLEIIRLAEKIPEEEVKEVFNWLSQNVGNIDYKGALTERSLKYQIRCYLATEKIVKERQLDFIGVKCHYELSEYYVTQCISCALCSDPYDWKGELKSPLVFACEADSDGALTMQILKMLSNTPTAFLDLRHYDSKEGVYVLCNCGALPTWFAGKSWSSSDNLKKVSLYPIIPKYGGEGAHIQFECVPGEVTFARLTRDKGEYQMTVFKGEFVEFPLSKLKETCWQWPHAFARINIEPSKLFDLYDSNHCHVVYGDYLAELVKLCYLLDIEIKIL